MATLSTPTSPSPPSLHRISKHPSSPRPASRAHVLVSREASASLCVIRGLVTSVSVGSRLDSPEQGPLLQISLPCRSSSQYSTGAYLGQQMQLDETDNLSGSGTGINLANSAYSAAGRDEPLIIVRKRLPHSIELVEDLSRLGPDAIASRLKQCISLSAGKRIHAYVGRVGLLRDTFIGNLLIGMYRRHKAVDDARLVFDSMPQHNVASWNAMIGAYSEMGHGTEALHLFRQMQQHGFKPDQISFLSILGVFVSPSALPEGKAIHKCIIDNGLQSDVVVATALLNMYGKCGALEDAQSVFDDMRLPDLVSWNAIISAYSQHGLRKEAFHLLSQMGRQGMKPNKVTFMSLLGAYRGPVALEEGRLIHASIVEFGLESHAVVGTALLNMYDKCDALEHARVAFQKLHQHDVISWNAIISAYSCRGHDKDARQCFQKMQGQGVMPNENTFIGLLNTCASPKALGEGKLIHSSIAADGLHSVMIGTALVQMYAKCEALEEARFVFDKMRKRDVITWTAMISAYSHYGCSEEAFNLFEQMKPDGVEPDSITFVSTLCACACPAALTHGKEIHSSIVHYGFQSDIVVENTLVNMYGKCGAVEDASCVFHKMQHRDIVSWNGMMAAYSQHGHGKESLHLFQDMLQGGEHPDEVTFVCLLSACSHAGFVNEGFHLFVSMVEDHCIAPTLDHYSCIVDLLGRTGQLEEAEKIVCKMPTRPDAVVWTALLGACQTHGDLERAEWAAEHVFVLEPQNAAPSILLSNMYAADER